MKSMYGKVVIIALVIIYIVCMAQIKHHQRASTPQGLPSTQNVVVPATSALPPPASMPNKTSLTRKAPTVSQPAKMLIALPCLLELGSDSCRPCQMMQPVLADLRQAYSGKLQVDFIDVWKDESAGKRYAVQTIPTQIFYNANGKEVFRHVGYYPKEEILAKFKELHISI